MKQSFWLRFLLVTLLALGIFFRFVNLDQKVYWFDETYTSLRISGYLQAEVIQQVFDGQVIQSEDLQKYQRPNQEKSLIDTIETLAVDDPHHPPLYYVLARLWVQCFGSSVAVTRSLSALISLLAFPCIYWLCRELFESSLTAWVAVALMTVSPFHVVYAQEARPYSLLAVSILFSSASLLRASRLKTKLSWVIYAASLALGFYTHLYFAFVAIGHGIYVLVSEKFRLSKTFNAYLLSSICGLLTFLPWILVILANLSQVNQVTEWVYWKTSRLAVLRSLAFNLCSPFFDLQFFYYRSVKYLLPLILILVGYSIYFCCRKTPKRVWVFILTLIGVTVLALVMPDLIMGGQRSTGTRFLIPCYLGIQLAVAYLLSTKITFIAVNLGRQKIWQIVAIALISCGVLSCAMGTQQKVWWNKTHGNNMPPVARTIDKASYPLVISDQQAVGSVLSLSYLLDPKVRLQLIAEPKIAKIPDGFSDVFLFEPSQALLHQIEPKYKIEPIRIYWRNWLGLWQLENK
jgi:uncharacterized membrane protein